MILEIKDFPLKNAQCLPPVLMKVCPIFFHDLFASMLLKRVYPDVWKVEMKQFQQK